MIDSFSDPDEGVAPILTARIKDLDLTKPVILEGGTSIREAAMAMRSRKIDVVLVHQEGRHGILTSADIRDALAITQVSVETSIAEIASWKLLTASPGQLLFHAFLLMTKRGVNRLVISDSHQVLGTLGLNELLSFMTNRASLIIQRIQQASSIADLADAVSHQAHLVHSLFSRGIKVRYIGWLLQELDRLVFMQVARLLAHPDLLNHMCILVLGSEGRGEQITKTDQDNALIADDDCPVAEVRGFCDMFTAALLKLGYPPCPGKVMMNNPRWSGKIGDFQNRFAAWLEDPNPTNLMQMAIFYDARAVVGKVRLFHEVRNCFMGQIPNDQAFYAHFAMPVLAFETPLGIFNRFIVEKGVRQGQIDLKKGGIFPIVHGARSLALEQRIRDPNTSRRIRRLIRCGVLDRVFGADLIDAFDFISGLRIQLGIKMDSGKQLDSDHLQLGSLGRLERENLRDSLAQVERFKGLIDHHFRLRMLQ